MTYMQWIAILIIREWKGGSEHKCLVGSVWSLPLMDIDIYLSASDG